MSECFKAYFSAKSWFFFKYKPEAVVTVVLAPDDGCQHPKHVELPTEI